MSDRRLHPLFKRWPLREPATLWFGPVPTPYHVYDGYGVMIGGTCDAVSARKLLRGEKLSPIETRERRVLAAIWVCDFTEASLEPHTELQFSFFMSRRPRQDASTHVFGLTEVMLDDDTRMLCHGLWNNSDKAVAFNEELLYLPAVRAESAIARDASNLQFGFKDIQAKSLIQGQLRWAAKQGLRDGLALASLLGVSTVMDQAKRPYVPLTVVNPVHGRLPHNADAQTAAANDNTVLRVWDDSVDRLTISHPLYRELDFVPDMVQQFSGARFVYNQPATAGLI
jgi:hypothetical protein